MKTLWTFVFIVLCGCRSAMTCGLGHDLPFREIERLADEAAVEGGYDYREFTKTIERSDSSWVVSYEHKSPTEEELRGEGLSPEEAIRRAAIGEPRHFRVIVDAGGTAELVRGR